MRQKSKDTERECCKRAFVLFYCKWGVCVYVCVSVHVYDALWFWASNTLITAMLSLPICLKVGLLRDLNGIGPQSEFFSLANEGQQQEGCPLPLPNLCQTPAKTNKWMFQNRKMFWRFLFISSGQKLWTHGNGQSWPLTWDPGGWQVSPQSFVEI